MVLPLTKAICPKHGPYIRILGCFNCCAQAKKADAEARANGEGFCTDCGLCTEGGLTVCPECDAAIQLV